MRTEQVTSASILSDTARRKNEEGTEKLREEEATRVGCASV